MDDNNIEIPADKIKELDLKFRNVIGNALKKALKKKDLNASDKKHIKKLIDQNK